MGNSPTALNKRGNKVVEDGYTFDSQKEYRFWRDFIRDSGFDYQVHPKFDLVESFTVDDKVKLRSISYKPDFVVRDSLGRIKHVYDVKNGFTVYAIDSSVQLRFKLFAKQENIPVEVAVVRAHDFKTKVLGVTKRYEPKIRKSIDYDWWDL